VLSIAICLMQAVIDERKSTGCYVASTPSERSPAMGWKPPLLAQSQKSGTEPKRQSSPM